jgi:pimeloyl-ACP methyl ester carboxylesterase
MDPIATMVTSPVDDGQIEVFSSGRGTAVVVVAGGGTDASIYRRLADRLARDFTVHVYNRRGRGGSSAVPADLGLPTVIDDLAAVLAAVGSTRLIGHSVGGFFALAGARELPVERVALFDPTVSVDGSFPTDFLPDLERAIDAGDMREAMFVAGRGLRNPGHNLPEPLQRAAVRLVLMTPPGKTMAEYFWTVPGEARLAEAADGPAANWAGVRARTRFYIGARSPGYYAPTARRLAAVMPDADVEMIPRLGHDALARAPRRLVDSLVRFLQ